MSVDPVLMNPFLSVLRFEMPKTRSYSFTSTLGDAKHLPREIVDTLRAAHVARDNVCTLRTSCV